METDSRCSEVDGVRDLLCHDCRECREGKKNSGWCDSLSLYRLGERNLCRTRSFKQGGRCNLKAEGRQAEEVLYLTRLSEYTKPYHSGDGSLVQDDIPIGMDLGCVYIPRNVLSVDFELIKTCVT